MNKSIILIMIMAIIIGFSCLVSNSDNKVYTPKFDYYLQLDKDQVYLIDKKGDTIHKETADWKLNESCKLKKSIIKDNL